MPVAFRSALHAAIHYSYFAEWDGALSLAVALVILAMSGTAANCHHTLYFSCMGQLVAREF
jgi:hypothetical protein